MSNKAEKPEASAILPQKTEGLNKVSFYNCLRFATGRDYLIVFGGILFSLLHGSAKGIFSLVVSLAVSSFDTRYTKAQFEDRVAQTGLYFAILSVCVFIGIIGSKTLLILNAQRQGLKFRRNYLKALLQNSVSYYEKINPMEFSSQIESDCKTIVDALEVHLESLFQAGSALTFGLVVSFLRSWQISLMLFCAAPFTFASVYFFNKIIVQTMSERSKAYSKAGAIAEEALTNIKTVVSLGGEKAELKKYNDAVEITQKNLVKNGILQGLTLGSTELFFMLIMAIITYIGSFYVEEHRINPSTGEVYVQADIFTPIYALLQGVSRIPILSDNLKGIGDAKVKARKILDVIDMTHAPNGAKHKITDFKGSISFKNVSFAYPAHPDKLILKNLDLQIKPNTKIAFVGESGSGKTTILQLLQRFYDPVSGTIELDGHDLTMIDASWLQRNVAYVGQEPVLFSMTIRENLLLAKANATEAELIKVLREANAFGFVMMMENKLDTMIGGGASTQLSGGQKQRIAIARALLKDARILLLDEATSALDRISEREIQHTLNNLLGERTIIIIAHRLSTIKDADQIILLNEGKVEEIGKHEELIQKRGKYYELNALQADISLSKHNNSPTEIYEAKLQQNNGRQSEDDDDDDDDDESENETAEEGFILMKNKTKAEKKLERKSLSFEHIKKLWDLAKDNKKYFIFGSLLSLLNSLLNPFNNLLVHLMGGVLVRPNNTEFRQEINLYCILFALLGVVIFMIFIFEFSFFSKASESLIQVLRLEVFYKFLRMHMGWHEQPKNAPGVLAASLEVDTSNVGLITGTSFGIIMQVVLGNAFILIFALLICWKLAISGIMIGLLVIFVAFRSNYNESQSKEKGTYLLSRSQVIVSEAINNIQTIISLGAQDKLLGEYSTMIDRYQKIQLKTKIMNALMFGGLYVVIYANFATMHYYGTYLYFSEGLAPYKIFFTVFGVVFSALASMQLFYLIPDTGKAIHSMHKIFDYFEMQSEIDIEDKSKVYQGKVLGNIEFKNVSFRYPTRNLEVFTNLSFNINAAQHVGLTGPSGCGKSTIIQLLLRLYDVDTGEILLEGVNIKDYDLSYLRRSIGIVSQEPVLFNGSIEYNLKYANGNVSDEEIIEAVEKANAARFIDSDARSMEDENKQNQGYTRLVGSKGSQLSGGQKQRIAIARAILRKPSILLLDEATSALDAESENLVQSALNTISVGLTTISVAHRFTTIQNTDEIMVLIDGAIIERGSYKELIHKQGYFYQLKQVQ